MNYQLPQTRIFQTFGESSTVRTSSLAPCIVAPFYDVHEDTYYGPFESVAAQYPYIGMSGDDLIMDSDIENGVFSLTLKNAQAQGYKALTYSTSPGTAGYLAADKKSLYTGMVVAEGGGFPVPAGFPALKVGDTVVHRSSGGAVKSVRKIASFQQANSLVATSLPTYATTGNHAPGDAQLTGTHSVTANTLLEFVVTTGGTVGSSPAPVLSLYIGGVAVQTGISSGNTLAAAGFSTLTITLAASSVWAAGDKITFGLAAATTATAQYNQGYSTIILDEPIATGDVANNDTYTLYYGIGNVTDPTGVTFDAEKVSIAASVTKNGLSIFSGDIYLTYRIRKNEYTEKVYTVSANGLEGMVGKAHPLNPLSMMCSLALRNSAGAEVCFVAVQFDNQASYEKAFEAIGVTNACWSIVPYSEDETIQRLAYEKALKFSSPEIMNWKTVWLGKDVEDIQTVLASFTGTVAGAAPRNVTTSNDISGVKFGDTLVASDGTEYTIMSVFTAVASPYLVLDTDVPAGTITGTILRKVSAVSKSEEVGAYARSFNSERVRVFFADGPYLTDYPAAECPMSYLAAAWAGKRGGAAPHQPLTRSELFGISTKGEGGFTVDNLNYMAGMGVWLTVTDNDGVTYCRHQLTTKNAEENYNFKEDSKVANADEISMTIRSSLDAYYGRTNVTDPAIEVIRLRAEEVVLTIQGRVWSDLIGPQITELESLDIERDASFSDRVNLYIVCTTPDPLNNLDIYLTIK